MDKIVQTAGKNQLGEFAPESLTIMTIFFLVKTGTIRISIPRQEALLQ